MRNTLGETMASKRATTALVLWALLVAIVSFAAAAFLPVAEFAKMFFALPGVVALFGVLVQLWRDSQAHERALEVQVRQQDFLLGTATHMADVAYDKHVEFCEEYIARTNTGLQEMYVHGPEDKAFDFAYDLSRIRMKYRAWLTQEIEDSLIPFEWTLREIAANQSYLKDLPTGDERSEVVRAMYDAFRLATGVDTAETEGRRAKTSAHVIDALRGVLGIRELTSLRQTTARLALERLASP